MSKDEKKTNLTIKQDRLVHAVVNGASSIAEGMRIAGYSESTIAHKANEIFNSPAVQSRLKEIIEEGQFDGSVLQTYKEILGIDLSEYTEPTDKALLGRLKLEATKEINKINGNYAPVRVNKLEAKFKFIPPKD